MYPNLLPVSLLFCVPKCCLRLVYPMLSVSLDLFLVCLSCVLCTLCCQFLWIVRLSLFVFVLCTQYVASFSGLFLSCLSSSCVPNVASFSGLFLFDFFFVLCTLCCQFLCIVFVPNVVFVLCTQCCQFLWIVFVLCLVLRLV